MGLSSGGRGSVGSPSRARLAALVALAIAAAATGRARADIIRPDITREEHDVYPFSGGESVTVGVKQFDPALGTLDSVTVNCNVTQTQLVSLSYENPFDFPASLGYFIPIGLRLSIPGERTRVLSNTTFLSGGITVPPFDGKLDGAGPDYVVIYQTRLLSGYDSFGLGRTLIGTGIVPFTFYILYSPSPFESRMTGRLAGQLDVTYTYTAVPEPSAAALLGVGALASLARAVRRGRAARRDGAGATPPGARAPRPHRGSAPS